MKRLMVIFTVAAAPLGFTQTVSAATSSVSTDLAEPGCTVVPASGEPGDSEDGLRCDGPNGYRLLTYVGDDRASASVVDPSGARHDLELWHVITRNFSTLGPRAEWVMEQQGGKPVPIALILEVLAHEDIDEPDRTTSYLAVVKLAPEETCVVERLVANGAEAAAAQRAAGAATLPCLGPLP